MNALRRDLVQRRLWPLVAILVLAIAAVPFVLRKKASASVSVPPAPSAARPLASVDAADTRARAHALLVSIPRDPFASGMPRLTAKPESAAKADTSSASGSSTNSSTSSAASMVSPSPVSSSSSPSSSSSSNSSGATTPTGADGGTGSSGTSAAAQTTATVTTTTTVTTAAPSNQWASAAAVPSWTIFSVALRFGGDLGASVRSNVARLTPLPSVAQPRVMFMGVVAGGQEAVFALGRGVQHAGPGLCRPDRSRCAAIMLRAGQTERITAPTSTGGQQTFTLGLVSIASHVTHSRTDALAAFNRHSAAGLCELDLANPVSYSQTDGTIASVASSAACHGLRGVVPFPG